LQPKDWITKADVHIQKMQSVSEKAHKPSVKFDVMVICSFYIALLNFATQFSS